MEYPSEETPLQKSGGPELKRGMAYWEAGLLIKSNPEAEGFGRTLVPSGSE